MSQNNKTASYAVWNQPSPQKDYMTLNSALCFTIKYNIA